jgi:hypothetical protein
VGLWCLCLAVLPLLMLAMLGFALAAKNDRAFYMAYCLDESGAVAIGGPLGSTISSRTGRALLLGRWWAKILAPIIDYFFGRWHCLRHANDPLQNSIQM